MLGRDTGITWNNLLGVVHVTPDLAVGQCVVPLAVHIPGL